MHHRLISMLMCFEQTVTSYTDELMIYSGLENETGEQRTHN